MLPDPLAPLNSHKTRSIASIYAPKRPKRKTSKMIDDIPIKQTLSPFHPLPAIGKKFDSEAKTKVFVFDLNKNKALRTGTMDERSLANIHEVLKPLTPLSIHSYTRKSSLDDSKKTLVRENTYDLIEPIYLNAKAKTDVSSRIKVDTDSDRSEVSDEAKVSPKTRFKKAALKVAKLSSVPETGKLLCLRERETFSCPNEDKSCCKLEELPRSPTQKLSKLSEIFQNLEMRGHHRDRMKKENTWF